MTPIAAVLLAALFQQSPAEGLQKTGETMEGAVDHLHRASRSPKPDAPADARSEVEAALERQAEALKILDGILEHMKTCKGDKACGS